MANDLSLFFVYLRLLYGKMHTRMSAKLVFARRLAIFRFLAGCQSNELSIFFRILFEPMMSSIDENIDLITMCQQIEISFDVRRMTPPLRVINRYVRRCLL